MIPIEALPKDVVALVLAQRAKASRPHVFGFCGVRVEVPAIPDPDVSAITREIYRRHLAPAVKERATK